MTATADQALLQVEGLQSGYGEIQVLWGIDLQVRDRRDHRADRLQRRRQDDADARAVGPGPDPRRPHPVAGPRNLRHAHRRRFSVCGIVHVPEGRRLFGAMSIEDNLLMGAYSRNAQPRRNIARDIDRYMRSSRSCSSAANRPAGTLSGGEQQMCAIGRGLMSAPRLLMIDELSLGLSPLLVEQLLEALTRLNREGMSILLVEQDVMTALEVSNTAYVMDTGRVVQHGESHVLLRDPAVRKAYLGALAGEEESA